MKKFLDATPEELSKIRGVCLDIDDTLSTQGKLTASSYESLWRLKEHGLKVVPITGRPAGWCDHFARFWPVDAVVGENGAFTFYMENQKRMRVNTPGGEADETKRKAQLTRLSEKIRAQISKATFASDQNYREYDLAIDFCEDVPRWSSAEIDLLLKICETEKAHAKISSIHVNTWFGDYDKYSGFMHWLQTVAAKKDASVLNTDQWVFIGDSPNDEPMFKQFKNSVAVANLKPFVDKIKHHPRWITSRESGEGFSEFASHLIASKG